MKRGARFLLLVLCWTSCSGPGLARVDVAELRCEYAANPVGVDTPHPRLSWVLKSPERACKQSVYRVLVASQRGLLEGDQGDLWDTDKVVSAQSINIPYQGKPLSSNQRVFWKVRIWGQSGTPSAWSEAAQWTMGLLDGADWQARWVRAPEEVSSRKGLPLFRKAFRSKGRLKRALVHVCGLGHYELFLNGEKVGDRFLDPAWSVYEKTVYYTTYDVTQQVKQGENAFGIMLGKGFFNTEGDRRVHGVHSSRPLTFILQLHLWDKHGEKTVVISDDTWKASEGPITHNAILGGSDYDARKLPEGWPAPEFRDDDWQKVILWEGPGGVLRASASPPMVYKDVFEPKSIEEPESGVFVYDFGQNASAVPRIKVRGAEGQILRLTPSEQRHGQTGNVNDGKGRVDQAGVGRPLYWEYTLRGGGTEEWLPQFHYSGYQYIEVTGAVPLGHNNPEGLPVMEALHSVHVRNDSHVVGTFSCSEPFFEKVDRLVAWAVQSNMAHVLTDCPHREKLGWLEVSYLMGPSIMGRFDIARFYAKKTRDIRESQGEDGVIYTVAPNYPAFNGGFRYTPEWGAAGVFLPWLLYEWYGDEQVLRENFEAMKRFVDYMDRTSKDKIAAPGLGDWYDYGHGERPGPSRYTPPELTATATFYLCAATVASAAEALGLTQEKEKYDRIEKAVKDRFNEAFKTGEGSYQNEGSPQTANAMGLVAGLFPREERGAAAEAIVKDMKSRGWQQTSGDIGFRYLIRALAEQERDDVLYKMLMREDLGSYGFIVKGGWTAMPEAWDARLSSSMNHCMLGHIQEWLFCDVAGIKPDPKGPGFERFRISPSLVGDLTWAEARHDSIRGPILSRWERDEGSVSLCVHVPCNAEATVDLPGAEKGTVTEQGQALKDALGVEKIQTEEGCLRVIIGSGQYLFEWPDQGGTP